MRSYVYLHGFASSSKSSKAQFFRGKLAGRRIDLLIPELDGGNFEHLTISGQLEAAGRAIAGNRVVLFGSSLGGYIAGLYAARHPEVEKLILLAPALDFRARWAARLGAERMEAWGREGSLPIFHYGEGRERRVGYELFLDAAHFEAYPQIQQPALVFQGLRDEVAAPEVAERFCAENSGAELRLFDSDHELRDVLPEMWGMAERFLFG